MKLFLLHCTYVYMYIHKHYNNVCVHEISGQATLKPLHYQCNLLFCVCASFPQGGVYFPVEHLESLNDKCHLKEKGLGKTKSVQMS